MADIPKNHTRLKAAYSEFHERRLLVRGIGKRPSDTCSQSEIDEWTQASQLLFSEGLPVFRQAFHNQELVAGYTRNGSECDVPYDFWAASNAMLCEHVFYARKFDHLSNNRDDWSHLNGQHPYVSRAKFETWLNTHFPLPTIKRFSSTKHDMPLSETDVQSPKPRQVGRPRGTGGYPEDYAIAEKAASLMNSDASLSYAEASRKAADCLDIPVGYLDLKGQARMPSKIKPLVTTKRIQK